jgi:hypothetical protein
MGEGTAPPLVQWIVHISIEDKHRHQSTAKSYFSGSTNSFSIDLYNAVPFVKSINSFFDNLYQ